MGKLVFAISNHARATKKLAMAVKNHSDATKKLSEAFKHAGKKDQKP